MNVGDVIGAGCFGVFSFFDSCDDVVEGEGREIR